MPSRKVSVSVDFAIIASATADRALPINGMR
jgi:hypothetical protein